MKHHVELSESGEEALRRLSTKTGLTPEELLTGMSEGIIAGAEVTSHEESADIVFHFGAKSIFIEAKGGAGMTAQISSNPGVMGGDTCIRNTRIPVWLLVAYKQSGQTDAQILANYPGLNASDLTVAWDYYTAHTAEIDTQRKAHEEAH